MWSLTSPRAKRISGSRKFRSSGEKDFFNTIGTKLTRLILHRKLFRLTLIVLDRLSVWESDTPTR